MTAYVDTNSKVALYHERGTAKIPPRPFLGLAVDNEREKFEGMVMTMVTKALGGDGFCCVAGTGESGWRYGSIFPLGSPALSLPARGFFVPACPQSKRPLAL